MPWSNQSGGGGPWGSGPRGPWGSGPQSPGGSKPPDLEELLRRSQDRLRGLLPGNLGGRGIALIALAAVVLWGFSGFFRVEPDELGVVLRFGKFIREVQPGLNYHLPYPIETALDAAGAAHQQDRHRHAPGRRPAPRHHRARGAGGKPDADRRREYRRRRFLGVLEGQAQRRRRLSVQHPKSRRHRQSGGRERHARGHRPLEYSADPHRCAADHRDGSAGPDAEDPRPLRRRHPDPASAVAKGRSASAGDRRLPRRTGRAHRPRALGQTRRRPTPTGSYRKRAAAPPRSPRTPKPIASRPSPRPTARPRASCRFTINTRRRPT